MFEKITIRPILRVDSLTQKKSHKACCASPFLGSDLDTPTTNDFLLAADPRVRQTQIRGEQIKVIFRHLPALILVNAVVAGAMVFGLWDQVANTNLIIWLSVMGAVLVARALLYWAHRSRTKDPSCKIWAFGFTLGSGLSGMLWGAVGIFLFPQESLEYQFFILFILMGMGAGAMSSLTAYLPALYAYLPVSLLPMGIMLIRVDDPIHIALGIMTFAYVGALIFFGHTINKALIESFGLRFRNIDLIQELSAQRDEAERANIAKSKFLAAASHDLRQPLQSLTLFASALSERIKYPEVSKIVSNIDASVRALEQLFNALLDISRLDAGVLQPGRKHFALQSLCARLINDYLPEAEKKGLMLECSVGDFVVHSDPALLERILRNYVSNAVRYTDAGKVRLSCVPMNGQIRIDVMDTGIGIPTSQQREIFSEFFQLGNPERDRTKGLGLGLAIVDRVAKLLGHAIEVESTPGQGSRFSVSVPFGDRGLLAVQSTETDNALSDLVGLNVLVVEDEISIREGMRMLLEQWGCRVTLAGSEDEAVALIRESGSIPGAIIADYRLRDDRTGAQAIERLHRELRTPIPALLISGDTAPDRLREARASGYQLMHKPVQPGSLRAFLRSLRKR